MSLGNNFPKKIQQLPSFEGPFEAYRLAAENCEVLFSSYPAGTKIDPHTHDTENVGIITKGVLLLTIGDKVEKINAGEWYHVPAHAEHEAEFQEETAGIELWFSTTG